MADPHNDPENELTSQSPAKLKSRTSIVYRPDAALLRDFIEFARRDVQLRQQEIESERQDNASMHEYNRLALSAQVSDRNDERRAARHARLETMLFALIGSLVLGAFLVICMRMGQAQIATDAIKNLGLVLISSYGGYQYAARKFSKEKD